MITDIEKAECERRFLPDGFLYKLEPAIFGGKLDNLNKPFESEDLYCDALKNAFRFNGIAFRSGLISKNRAEVMDKINVQFNYYNEGHSDMYRWLDFTYNLIINGTGTGISQEFNIEIQSDFKEWFNRKIKENRRYYQSEIVSELIGQRNNMNSPRTTQPCYHYIKDVLSKYELTPVSAKEMVNDFKGNFAKDWNDNVIPFIIEYLRLAQIGIGVSKEIQPQQASSQEGGPTPINKYPRFFVNGWAYELFERLRAEIVIQPKQNYSDYSFIFQSMIKDGYLIQTKHNELIKFIDKEYSTTIGEKYFQFNTSDSERKKKVYSRCNKEFKSKITSLL